MDAVEKISDKEYLLDGHFCLLNSSGEVEQVPLDTFKQLPIKAIVIIYDDVEKIVDRLNTRDGVSNSKVISEKFQNGEVAYAKELADLRCVPFMTHNCSNNINDRILIYGQESSQTIWRLCKMNLAIRGIDSSNVRN